MSTIHTASAQWASRPADERFTSLYALGAAMRWSRENSKAVVVGNRKLEFAPTDDNAGLLVHGPNGHGYAPTHWAFGQLAQLAEAPAGYLRTLPAPVAADCLNYGLKFKRDVEEVGVLLQRPHNAQLGDDGTITPMLTAATGPRYGRVWNSEVADALVNAFGDGATGRFRVPGEFGRPVPITNQNTTFYAGDRDMFVFLADESNLIEVPDPMRSDRPDVLARGLFVWNSQVGAGTLGVASFLYRYVCKNRIVWGASGYQEIKVRHTSGAPDRFMEEIKPALLTYADSSQSTIVDAVKAAKAKRAGSNSDEVAEFLAKRFGKRAVQPLQAVHELEEGRPIESMWDVINAATARARSIGWQDERVAMERQAGELMAMVAGQDAKELAFA